MLVTDLALRDMEEEAQSLLGPLRRLLDRLWGRRHPAQEIMPSLSVATGEPGLASILTFHSASEATPPAATCEDTADRLAATGPDSPFKWRRHPQLRDRSRNPSRNPGDRTPADVQRDARAAAVRGIFLARGERLGEARAAFAQAAADPSIDLSNLPGFWQLSRSAMLIAATAYEDVERFRDASALSAQVRTRYRPQAVAPVGTVGRRRTPSGNT